MSEPLPSQKMDLILPPHPLSMFSLLLGYAPILQFWLSE